MAHTRSHAKKNDKLKHTQKTHTGKNRNAHIQNKKQK